RLTCLELNANNLRAFGMLPRPHRRGLVVKSHEVVPGQHAADGRTTVETGMMTMPIMVVQPARHHGVARAGGSIRAHVGPLAQQRLDETRVGPSSQAPQAAHRAQRGERVTEIREGVVGHDPADPDALAAIPGQRPPEKRAHRAAPLVGEELGVGQARGIIDGPVAMSIRQKADASPGIAAHFARMPDSAMATTPVLTEKYDMPSRCCISQLRSDAALSNVPADKAGAASGIYKMASSLGAALGVAISAAIFTALSGLEGELVPLSDVFLGRSDNIDIRLAGAVALLFNARMVAVAM